MELPLFFLLRGETKQCKSASGARPGMTNFESCDGMEQAYCCFVKEAKLSFVEEICFGE